MIFEKIKKWKGADKIGSHKYIVADSWFNKGRYRVGRVEERRIHRNTTLLHEKSVIADAQKYRKSWIGTICRDFMQSMVDGICLAYISVGHVQMTNRKFPVPA